jgi:hypothetical protein
MSNEGVVLDVPFDVFQAEPSFDVGGDVATGEEPGQDMEYQEVKAPIFVDILWPRLKSAPFSQSPTGQLNRP